MAAPMIDRFDPLQAFAGRWTTTLAERYLPIPDAPWTRYECVDGRLYMSAAETFYNGYAHTAIARLLGDAVDAAGMLLVSTVNLTFTDIRWIIPDLAVFAAAPSGGRQQVWVPFDKCVMPIEIVSPSSRERDYIDKPALCAAAGIPYFMQIEIAHSIGPVTVTLMRLRPDGHNSVAARASSGEQFTMTRPFPASFDPERLLVP